MPGKWQLLKDGDVACSIYFSNALVRMYSLIEELEASAPFKLLRWRYLHSRKMSSTVLNDQYNQWFSSKRLVKPRMRLREIFKRIAETFLSVGYSVYEDGFLDF